MLLRDARLFWRNWKTSPKTFQLSVFSPTLAFFHSYLKLHAGHETLPKNVARRRFEEEAAAPQSKDQDHKPRKVKHTYTLRDVIKENHRSLIDSQIPYPPGEPEYIARFQAAVTTVLNNMTEEDLEDVQNTVEQWNQEGAPSQVQLKSVFNVSSIIGPVPILINHQEGKEEATQRHPEKTGGLEI